MFEEFSDSDDGAMSARSHRRKYQHLDDDDRSVTMHAVVAAAAAAVLIKTLSERKVHTQHAIKHIDQQVKIQNNGIRIRTDRINCTSPKLDVNNCYCTEFKQYRPNHVVLVIRSFLCGRCLRL